VVYFGFDEAAISPQAQAIVAKAAGDVATVVTLNSDYRAQMTRYNAMMTPSGQSPPALDAQAQEAYPPSEDVVGYADTSGSIDYNLRLSERRAKAAADALVALGVPTASIQVSWKGEADPAVATGDNVREPMNRRVTIHVAAGM
jgi:outer membrane protein OmpA-like peptidoglycan-associated protein